MPDYDDVVEDPDIDQPGASCRSVVAKRCLDDLARMTSSAEAGWERIARPGGTALSEWSLMQ